MSGAMRYYVGLDLGKQQDPSALAVLERPLAEPVPTHRLRHLQRWPLGTPYPRIVDDVIGVLQRPPLPGCALLVDQTGVGAAVVDLFRDRRPGRVTCSFWPVTITGGSGFTMNRQVGLHVAKYELVAALAVLFETRRLRVARGLPEADALVRELETFQVKLSKARNETFEAWRDGDRDDLVLAAAMTAFAAENDARNARRQADEAKAQAEEGRRRIEAERQSWVPPGPWPPR
jgi:hypothetical protein